MIDYMRVAQILTLALSVLSIVYVLFWAHSDHKWGNYTLPIFFFLLHQCIFYVMVLYAEIVLGQKLDEIYGIPRLGEIWSAVLRTHGTITTLFSVITVKFQIIRFFRKDFMGLLDNDTR